MSKIKIFALGGLNENSKNMYVVEINQDIFVFEAGLKYADEKFLGVDYIIPDYTYIKNNIKRVKGIFVSHAHQEQIGALKNIIEEIPNIKVFATKFTLDFIKSILNETGVVANNLVEISPHKKINFGSISVFPISLTHSLPDNVGYVINTEDGAIVYTGNFVFDPTMRGSFKTDIGKLAYVGKQGVLCLMAESLYADKKGYTSPNHRIANVIKEALIRNENRIIFNIFSNNVCRIQELFDEVSKTHRKLIIMGKSLQSMIKYLLDNNYIFINREQIGDLSNLDDRDAVILTSSDNERPFSNLERILNGYDKYIKIKNTDTVFFLDSITDSVEKVAVRIMDNISRIGAEVITLPRTSITYHASSEDLMLMLDLINPKYYFPITGEYRHQVANADVASKIGVPKENILLKLNGDVITFENGNLVDNFEHIEAGDIMIDGTSSEDIGALVLKDREMLSDNGIVVVCATLDKKTKEVLAGPTILTRGFVYVKDSADLIKEIERISLEKIIENTTNNYVEYNKIKNAIREEVGKYLYLETECKPMIITVIQEV
ncbi:MAG: ribonuclease J [Bacilli bacterium]|nr:ribonuclease J [Bacilli bacterium]MBQ6282687.1 ribonuclease J [Bacilli bacterium]